jgi:trehalose 6-phosphate phosphatase
LPRARLTPAEAITLTAGRAAESGFLLDFDGTLAPIVEDPDAVWPVPGAVEALAGLAAAVGRVAVVSARPVEFLHERLRGAGPLALHGLYGLETWRPGEPATTDPDALAWAPLVDELAGRARVELPAGVRVEPKRLSVALHYRAAPELRREVERWADERAARHGLVAQRGRMVVELRPPVRRDKGDVVAGETGDLAVAWYFGDDLSDLEAFRALDEREAASPGFTGVRVAVANPETGGELAAAADLVLGAPGEVPGLLDGVTRAVRERAPRP